MVTVVFLNEVPAKIAIKIAPNGMDMVGIVLGIVKFN